MRSASRPTALLVALALAGGCGPSAERRAADRAEVEKLLAGYAVALTEAYRTGDPAGMSEVATGRETERVRARIQELAQEGRELAATLREQRIVELDFHRATGATAVAFETWDLRVLTAGTDQVVAESLAQQNRIVYSLSRDGGRWWVLSRLLASSSEAP
jgi:hypothetical protein